jgi:hypothetical protein
MAWCWMALMGSLPMSFEMVGGMSFALVGGSSSGVAPVVAEAEPSAVRRRVWIGRERVVVCEGGRCRVEYRDVFE